MPDALFALLLQVVTFGAGFSAVFALAQLVRQRPALADVLNFLVFLGNSVIQWFVVSYAAGVLPERPVACFPLLTSLFLLGPANYLYHHILLHPDQPVPTRLRLQFIPAALALVAEIAFQALPASVQQPFLAALLRDPLSHPFTLVLLAATLTVFVYSTEPLRLGLAVLGREGTRPQVRVILAAFGATLVAILLVSLGFVTASPGLVLAGGALVTLINVLVFLATIRYPDFYRLVGQEIRKARYERSMLRGVDTDAVGQRLEELMTVDAVYRDLDLSLESLAQKLSITPHQLSQYLNERLNTNFRGYVNARRIEEAKKLLAGEDGSKILAVCFDVGFSSKSTFNQAFRKQVGQTPSEYRQEQLAGRAGASGDGGKPSS